MWKSKKFIILTSVLAVVLVLAVTAGVVLAQDGKQGTGPGKEIMARVAQILGVDQQKLGDAFKQATTEYRAQHPRPQISQQDIEQRLQQLVKDGKIKQEQADQLKAWWAKKPAADPKANPQQFQDWLKSRPSIQLPKPDGTQVPGPFPHWRFFGPKPPPKTS